MVVWLSAAICLLLKVVAVAGRRVPDQLLRAVLSHALLSYLFGVVIIGGSVNLIAGLLR